MADLSCFDNSVLERFVYILLRWSMKSEPWQLCYSRVSRKYLERIDASKCRNALATTAACGWSRKSNRNGNRNRKSNSRSASQTPTWNGLGGTRRGCLGGGKSEGLVPLVQIGRGLKN